MVQIVCVVVKTSIQMILHFKVRGYVTRVKGLKHYDLTIYLRIYYRRQFRNKKGRSPILKTSYDVRKRRRWLRKWSPQIDQTFVTRLWQRHVYIELILLSTSIPNTQKIRTEQPNEWHITQNKVYWQCLPSSVTFGINKYVLKKEEWSMIVYWKFCWNIKHFFVHSLTRVTYPHTFTHFLFKMWTIVHCVCFCIHVWHTLYNISIYDIYNDFMYTHVSITNIHVCTIANSWYINIEYNQS